MEQLAALGLPSGQIEGGPQGVPPCGGDDGVHLRMDRAAQFIPLSAGHIHGLPSAVAQIHAVELPSGRRGRAVGVGLPLGVEPCGPEVGVRHRRNPHASGFCRHRHRWQEREHCQQSQKQCDDSLFHKTLSDRERWDSPLERPLRCPPFTAFYLDFECKRAQKSRPSI